MKFPCTTRVVRTASLVSLAILAISHVASAQARAERVPDPGRSIASSSDASAVGYNPANLRFLPGADFRWTWVRPADESPTPTRGHSLSFATPLFAGLATGLRMDFVRPSDTSSITAPYSMLTWGLAAGSEVSSLGLSIARTYSNDTRVDGPTAISLGWSGRPTRYVGVASVFSNINTPETRRGAKADFTYDLALAVRPLGTRSLEIGLEDRYYADVERWVPRATLGLDLPYVGRLRGDFSIDKANTDHPNYTASAMIDVSASKATLTGGAIISNSSGPNAVGFVGGVGLSGWREPGIPSTKKAFRIRFDETPGNRSHIHLLRKLWRIADDPEYSAVVLHLKTSPADSTAHGTELGDAIDLIRARGKKVLCHLEDADGRALQVCSHADRIVLNPAGGLRFAGLYRESMYLGGLLDKLGVRAEFVRIGSFKSAAEQFTNTQASETARAANLLNLAETENEFIWEVSRGRHLEPAKLRATIAHGPFTAREALRDGLVDGFAYDDEVRTVVAELVGHAISLDDDLDTKAPKYFGLRPSVALVYLDGNMIDGRSRRIPILGTRLAGSYTIAKTFKEVRENPLIEAVVLRIESPGGSSMSADVMWREIELTAREKPVIVSMGKVAASGGYYAAAPAKMIFATPYTVTGSIGIFYGKADVSGLLAKLGISTETIRTAPRADAESMYRGFTDEERAELGAKVKQFYDVFIDRVSRGRHMTADQVHAVAQGRVWMGRAAQSHGLVDRIGGIRQALIEARYEAGLPPDAPIIELPPPDSNLLEAIASAAGVQTQAADPTALALLPGQFGDVVRSLGTFVLYSPDQPMALLEFADSL